VVVKIREKLSVSKQGVQKFHKESFSFRKAVYCGSQTPVSNRFAALGNLDDDDDINRTWESIR
jgi:hypothetical protein